MIQLDTDKSNLDPDFQFHELLLNEIGVYAFLKDLDGKYVYVNEVTRKLFDRTLDDIIGFDDGHFFDLDKISKLVENDQRVFSTGKQITEEEVNVIKSTGEVKVYRTVKKPIYNNSNKIIGLLGVSTDITDIYNLKEKLKKEATTDSLTGLYNRRFFFEMAEKYFSKSTRHKQPFSVIIIDIDLFKQINDTYGHSVGDTVISLISKQISVCIRKEDVLARVGGEEFAILLPHTNMKKAQLVAEKVRVLIARQQISGEWDGLIHPTVSLGVATHEDDASFMDIYVRADKALYTSKKLGRNRVSVN